MQVDYRISIKCPAFNNQRISPNMVAMFHRCLSQINNLSFPGINLKKTEHAQWGREGERGIHGSEEDHRSCMTTWGASDVSPPLDIYTLQHFCFAPPDPPVLSPCVGVMTMPPSPGLSLALPSPAGSCFWETMRWISRMRYYRKVLFFSLTFIWNLTCSIKYLAEKAIAVLRLSLSYQK